MRTTRQLPVDTTGPGSHVLGVVWTRVNLALNWDWNIYFIWNRCKQLAWGLWGGGGGWMKETYLTFSMFLGFTFPFKLCLEIWHKNTCTVNIYILMSIHNTNWDIGDIVLIFYLYLHCYKISCVHLNKQSASQIIKNIVP